MSGTESSNAFSTLKMHHIVFDELSFTRKGFQNIQSNDIQFKVNVMIGRNQEGIYKVTLRVDADKEDEYEASAQVTGYCEIDADCSLKDDILKKNTVAILFPYIRAELTLLTAQPETTPITLPAMNINALIDEAVENPT